jgi:MoxR-like ATPase
MNAAAPHAVPAGPDWRLYTGSQSPHDGITRLPAPPPWRPFRVSEVARERTFPTTEEDDKQLPAPMQQRGRTFQAKAETVELVNAALYLRRPLLVTGKPGSGKSSLIDAVCWELRLGEPLRWAVTSRSTVREALYVYDAVGRLQEIQRRVLAKQDVADVPIADFLRLGALGTALLPTDRPRGLLVDEIDKADLDLPNDLLNLLEEGEFEIPELARLAGGAGAGQDAGCVPVRLHRGGPADTYPVSGGVVRMKQFPFVVFTSNGEREFPPAFLRRCLRLDMPDPATDATLLTQIVQAHLAEIVGDPLAAEVQQRIDAFIEQGVREPLATDQLLNAVFLLTGRAGMAEADKAEIARRITRALA